MTEEREVGQKATDVGPTTSGTKTQPKLMVSNTKFEVERFDGTNNFGIWQCEMMDVLTQ